MVENCREVKSDCGEIGDVRMCTITNRQLGGSQKKASRTLVTSMQPNFKLTFEVFANLEAKKVGRSGSRKGVSRFDDR